MAKKKWYKFQILLQYLVGSPHGLSRVHTLGVVSIEQDDTESVPEMAQRATEEIIQGQPHLRTIIETGGAKVWAKAID